MYSHPPFRSHSLPIFLYSIPLPPLSSLPPLPLSLPPPLPPPPPKPTTELECEVAAVLASSSEHVGSNDQELTEAEKSALLSMSLEEVRRLIPRLSPPPLFGYLQ